MCAAKQGHGASSISDSAIAGSNFWTPSVQIFGLTLETSHAIGPVCGELLILAKSVIRHTQVEHSFAAGIGERVTDTRRHIASVQPPSLAANAKNAGQLTSRVPVISVRRRTHRCLLCYKAPPLG